MCQRGEGTLHFFLSNAELVKELIQRQNTTLVACFMHSLFGLYALHGSILLRRGALKSGSSPDWAF